MDPNIIYNFSKTMPSTQHEIFFKIFDPVAIIIVRKMINDELQNNIALLKKYVDEYNNCGAHVSLRSTRDLTALPNNNFSADIANKIIQIIPLCEHSDVIKIIEYCGSVINLPKLIILVGMFINIKNYDYAKIIIKQFMLVNPFVDVYVKLHEIFPDKYFIISNLKTMHDV